MSATLTSVSFGDQPDISAMSLTWTKYASGSAAPLQVGRCSSLLWLRHSFLCSSSGHGGLPVSASRFSARTSIALHPLAGAFFDLEGSHSFPAAFPESCSGSSEGALLVALAHDCSQVFKSHTLTPYRMNAQTTMLGMLEARIMRHKPHPRYNIVIYLVFFVGPYFCFVLFLFVCENI